MPSFDALAHALRAVVAPYPKSSSTPSRTPSKGVRTADSAVSAATDDSDVMVSAPPENGTSRVLFRPATSRMIPVSDDADTTSMPVVYNAQQTWFRDRFDVNKTWYLPAFEILDPTGNFFTIADNGHNSKDQPMFKATVTLAYREVDPPDVVTQRKAYTARNLPHVFVKVPVTVQSVGVVIRYGAADAPIESPARLGTLLANNQVQFQVADDNDNSYASLLYRNLSNYKNDNQSASFVFTVTFSGWHSFTRSGGVAMLQANGKTPVTSARLRTTTASASAVTASVTKNARVSATARPVFDDTEGVRAEGYRRVVTANHLRASKVIPCSGTNGYVYQKPGEPAVPVGCNPPWSSEYTNGLFYRRYILPEPLQSLPINGYLFQQIAQPHVFLVIPKQYCISLDDDEFLERAPDEYAPDIVLTSLINPNPGHEAENTLRLDMILKPGIADLELQLIKQTIMEALPLVPQFKYPADLGILSVKDFEPAAGVYELTQGSQGFKLTFQSSEGKFTQSLLNLAQVNNPDAVGLSLPLHYAIDQQNNQSSLLNVHLKKTVGNVLKLRQDAAKGELTITNFADYPVAVYGLLFYTEGKKGFVYGEMPTALAVLPKQEAVVPIATTFPEQAASIKSFSHAAAHYEIQEDDEQLNEIRLNMDLQSIRIPIAVAGLDAAAHRITSLKVHVMVDFMNSLLQMPEPLVKTITPMNGAFAAGDEAPFLLTYPLSYGIDSAKANLEYWVAIAYADKPAQTTKKFSQNFGATPRITITSDLLKADNLAQP